MSANVVLFDYENHSAYSGWREWYYFDKDGYPRAVVYKRVPMESIMYIHAGDGWLSVNMKDREQSFTCYGYMMPENEFVKDYNLLDRKTESRQDMIRKLYERENEMSETIHGISERFLDNLRSLIHLAYSYSYMKEHINSLLCKVRDELLEFPSLPYFDLSDETYHPFCEINISELQPNAEVRLNDGDTLSVYLDKDSETLLNLIRLDKDSIDGCFE